MNIIHITLLWLLLSIVIILVDRRNFIGVMSLGLSCVLLLSIVIYNFLNKLHQLSNRITNYVFVILLVTVMITISCLAIFFIQNSKILEKKEGQSFVSKINFLFGINFILLLLLSLVIGTEAIRNIYLNKVLIIIFLADLFTCTMFLSFLVYSYIYQVNKYIKSIDYIIILGSGIQTMEVTPLLQSRIDNALRYYKSHPSVKFVVSGGQGSDEPISESEAMKNYMVKQGIPENIILMESSSTSTLENMIFSKKVIFNDWRKNNLSTKDKPKILFSTSNYHVFRGSIFSKKVGLNARGVGAPTPLYFLPSALIREFIGLIYIYKYIYAVLILLIIIAVLLG